MIHLKMSKSKLSHLLFCLGLYSDHFVILWLASKSCVRQVEWSADKFVFILTMTDIVSIQYKTEFMFIFQKQVTM